MAIWEESNVDAKEKKLIKREVKKRVDKGRQGEWVNQTIGQKSKQEDPSQAVSQ